MKLTFLTLAPFSSNPGHLARLAALLNELSMLNKVNIICLGKNPDNLETKAQYPNVSFSHFPISFAGWEIKNLSRTVKNLVKIIQKDKPDLVILQMEVWELMRELSHALKNITAFTTVLHAMPFVVAPTKNSGDFEKDVVNYLSSGIEKYRVDYIKNHYQEAHTILHEIPLIACYKTVSFYLKTYFNDLCIFDFISNVKTLKTEMTNGDEGFKYDFAYMARMEAGKGIEYLDKILSQISQILSRPVTIAILGRTDDQVSSETLNKLLNRSKMKNNKYHVDYLGWASEEVKIKVLTKTKVFLYPSNYDNYAIVLQEALTFGLPVITWDVPFTSLNYRSTKAVKRVPLLDIQLFAKEATKALLKRNFLSNEALKFINSLKTPKVVAQSDSKIYHEIINLKRNNYKS